MERLTWMGAAALGASLAGATLVWADAERTCPNQSSPGLLESWGNIPAGGIVLDLADGVGGLDRAAPGLPPESGMRGLCNFTSNQLPVWQSIAAAANEVSQPSMPTSGGLGGASSFAINPTPTSVASYPAWLTWETSANHSTLLWPFGGGTTRNQVTFWEHPGIWGMMGTTTIAAARVRVAGGTGTIVECDIALNAMTESASNGNRPYWTFVEDNATFGQTLVTGSYSDFAGSLLQDPVFGYVDIQGVLTHEFGHLAGLAHSLVDCATNTGGSETPTMYASIQSEPFAQVVAKPVSGCTSFVPFNADGSGTLYRGIVGRPARSLAADDVAALSVAYPGADQPLLGSISGTVVNAAGALPGAHVVAVSSTSPEVVRVGVLSYDQGIFNLGSLPPGDYYVFVEPPDLGGFFAGTSPPEFIDPTAFCVNPPNFTAEYWDASEGFGEALPQAATAITVTAGQVSGPILVQVDPAGGNPLRAAACNTVGTTRTCTPFSIRGAVHKNLGGSQPEMVLNYSGGAQGELVALGIALDRANLPLWGQLLEPTLAGPTHIGVLSGALGATGTLDFTLPVSAGLAKTSFFMQAVRFPAGGGNPIVSNTVSTWLER